MRWKQKAKPKEGDIRVDVVFAWWPVKTGKEWVWLGYYVRHMQYISDADYGGPFDDHPIAGWIERRRF